MPNSTSTRESGAVGGKEFGRSGGLRESILTNSCMSNCFGASPINFISSSNLQEHLAMLLKCSFPIKMWMHGQDHVLRALEHADECLDPASTWLHATGCRCKCASLRSGAQRILIGALLELDLAVVLIHNISRYSASSGIIC